MTPVLPNISIDLSSTIQELTLSREEVKVFSKYILDKAAYSYMQLWEKKVDEGLHQTKSAYKSGMSYEFIDDYNVAFVLSGKGQSKLALMIEEGTSAFDMKQGFMNSPKAKDKKDGGWYLTIPFRHATTEAVAESGIFSTIMPKSVMNVAKSSSSAVKRPELPGQHQELLTNRLGYQHKAAIYEGLIHIDSGNKTKQGYYTMRRVSDKSDEDSWINKGFQPHNFMDRAFEDFANEIGGIVSQARKEFLDEII